MKCTQCGNEELFLLAPKKTGIEFYLENSSTPAPAVSDYIQVFACSKCGHYEWYNPKIISLVSRRSVLMDSLEILKEKMLFIQSKVGKINSKLIAYESEISLLKGKSTDTFNLSGREIEALKEKWTKIENEKQEFIKKGTKLNYYGDSKIINNIVESDVELAKDWSFFTLKTILKHIQSKIDELEKEIRQLGITK